MKLLNLIANKYKGHRNILNGTMVYYQQNTYGGKYRTNDVVY